MNSFIFHQQFYWEKLETFKPLLSVCQQDTYLFICQMAELISEGNHFISDMDLACLAFIWGKGPVS